MSNLPSNTSDNKILQPMRFVDSIFNFTPIQEDLILLVQKQMTKSKKIKTSFSIDLKPYLESKKLKIKDIRSGHYDKLSKELLNSVVSFKYLKGDKLFQHYNLFKKSSVDKNFILEVEIIEDVLPLFYINKLKEGHFKDSKLVKELYESSFPEYDTYVAIPPRTFIEFNESSIKNLYRKLLQYRKNKEHTYEFTKDELYQLFGYGYIEDIQDENLFGIQRQVFVQEKYKGQEGWKTLSKKMQKWLKIISDHSNSGLEIISVNNKYFVTKGRPIRSVYIRVKYDDELRILSLEEQKVFNELDNYGLSEKQKYNIMKDFDLNQILPMIRAKLIRMRNPINQKIYFGEYERSDHRKIENVPGYVYGYVFNYGKKDL